MSFGYGVGDFLAILKLTNNVRKRFINAPAQFKAVSDDTKTLSNVLRDIEDFHFEAGLDDRQQKHLNNISHDCHCVLQELEDVLDRYQELGPDKGLAGTSRRVWKRIKWDQSEINSVQQRIHGNIKVFNLFLAGLTSHVVFAIQEGVDQINNTLDNQVRQEIINWLAPISYAAQQSDILNRRQAGTGQWLLNTKVFKQWLDNEKQTLFCPGIPGAGKTVLTSVVIDHLEKKFSHNPSIGIAYLYCNFRRHHEQRLEDLAASLLKQLAQRQPLFPDTVRSLYNHHRNTGTRPSLDELLRILYSVTASYSRVFIMVDALDEYNMTSGSLTKFLTELFNMQSKHNINLFATSRHNPVIQSAFENSLIQEIRARNEDVQSYLLSHLHQLPSFVSRNSQLQNEIIEAISESVDGMFLLAHLHLSSLIGKRSPKAIKNTLNKLPCGTDAYDVAYEDAMQRIECQVTDQKEMANQVLSWITCAQRPLTIFELQHALAVEIEESEFDQDNLPDAEDILNACAGLVTIDEESCVIRLVHYTTQEYFERTWIRWFSSAHYGITRVCIAYLSYDVFESGLCATDHDFENRLQEYPLYDYCSQYWGYHTRMQAVEQEWILNLLVDEGKVSSCAQALVTLIGYPQVIRRIHQAPRSVTGVHLAAHFGLETTLRYLIANESICNSPDSTGQMPLSWAAKNGQVKVVRLLLDRFHDPDSKDNDGLTALALTSENGHDEVVKMLLEEGADPNSEDNAGRTPLALAAANGHVSTVNVLLEFNADPETKDTESGWTALSWAAGNGHDEVVMLLLSKGVDLESQDNHGRTPLSWAVDNGHEEVVQSLLDHGAHPDQEDGDGQRPLLYATYNGNEDMVQLLLKHGANLQSTNPGHGLTPLGWAVMIGHEAVVEFLVRNGADIEFRDPKYDLTPLLLAAEKGRETIFKLLLNSGCDPHYRNHHGRTPLSYSTANGHEKVTKLLLETASDPNSRDRFGRTPLMGAAAAGHLAIARILLSTNTVNTSDRDIYGRDALFEAQIRGHGDIVNLLLGRGITTDTKTCAISSDTMESKMNHGHAFCDICLVRISKSDHHFHCDVCLGGDFDICRFCIDSGASCLDDSHGLVRKATDFDSMVLD